jgi:hypothetical protein
MTTTDAYAQFGYSLAMTEQALTEVLRRHLAERDTEPETWYALQLLAINGPALEREALRGRLERSRTLDAEKTERLLARLQEQGLIRGESAIELTPRGRALHESLSEYIGAARAELLSQFDVGDVETTVRTLQAIGDRAAQELAPAPPR